VIICRRSWTAHWSEIGQMRPSGMRAGIYSTIINLSVLVLDSNFAADKEPFIVIKWLIMMTVMIKNNSTRCRRLRRDASTNRQHKSKSHRRILSKGHFGEVLRKQFSGWRNGFRKDNSSNLKLQVMWARWPYNRPTIFHHLSTFNSLFLNKGRRNSKIEGSKKINPKELRLLFKVNWMFHFSRFTFHRHAKRRDSKARPRVSNLN